MGFSGQEYWSGLPFPSPGDLPDPGMEPGSPALQADSLPSELPGKPLQYKIKIKKKIPFTNPSGSVSKESDYNAGDPGLIPGSGRSSGEGNGNPPQYSYLENSMDRGVWQATVHGVAKSQT